MEELVKNFEFIDVFLGCCPQAPSSVFVESKNMIYLKMRRLGKKSFKFELFLLVLDKRILSP